MSKSEPQKRTLKYAGFDNLYADIEHLMVTGYRSQGNWNLAQALTHVADWMRYPIDGFPTPPIFLRPVFWLLKVTIGPSMKRKILIEGFSAGIPTAPESVPSADQNTDQEAYDFLRETIQRVNAHQGQFKPSPLFGPMDKELLNTVMLLHAAHHLGYLAPKSDTEPAVV